MSLLHIGRTDALDADAQLARAAMGCPFAPGDAHATVFNENNGDDVCSPPVSRQ
jgi:hypothetical protein